MSEDSKHCLQCGKQFARIAGHKGESLDKWHTRKFCSVPCYRKHDREMRQLLRQKSLAWRVM